MARCSSAGLPLSLSQLSDRALPQYDQFTSNGSSGQNSASQNPAVDNRIAGHAHMESNGTSPARRCRARRAAPCTSAPDSKRDRFPRRTAPNVCTVAAQRWNRTYPQRERLQSRNAKAVMLACRVERSFCGKSWGTHVRSPGRGKARGQATNQHDSG
jgi:hypothetical protein